MKRAIIIILTLVTVTVVNAQTVRRSGVRDDIATKGKGSKPRPSTPSKPKPNTSPNRNGSHSSFHLHQDNPSEGSKKGFRFEPTSTKNETKPHDSDENKTDTLDLYQYHQTDEKAVPQDTIRKNNHGSTRDNDNH